MTRPQERLTQLAGLPANPATWDQGHRALWDSAHRWVCDENARITRAGWLTARERAA